MDGTAPQSVSPGEFGAHTLAPRLSLLFIIILAVLMVILSAGGYFLGRQTGQNAQNKEVAVAKPSGLPEGAVKFLNLVTTHTPFITNSKIQMGFYGVLVSLDPGKSWAIERKGETAIISNESGEPVEYFVKNGEVAQRVDAGVLKVGDRVSITTSIDVETGITTVKRVTKAVKESSASATPSVSSKQ